MIGLVLPATIRAKKLEFITRPRSHTGDEDFPNTGPAQRTHRVGGAIPVIEMSDHANRARIGCPDTKRGAIDFSAVGGQGANMCAQHMPQSLVTSLGNKEQIKFADGGS